MPPFGQIGLAVVEDGTEITNSRGKTLIVRHSKPVKKGDTIYLTQPDYDAVKNDPRVRLAQ